MAVSGGAEALAALREGLGHLRSSLAVRPRPGRRGAAARRVGGGPAPGRFRRCGRIGDHGRWAPARRAAPVGPAVTRRPAAARPVRVRRAGRAARPATDRGSRDPCPRPWQRRAPRPAGPPRLTRQVRRPRPAPRRPGLTDPIPLEQGLSKAAKESHDQRQRHQPDDPRRRAPRRRRTPTASAATTGSSTLDQDTFLKLLVAQLKYQDPSSPSDPTQFMSETAQFTVVAEARRAVDARPEGARRDRRRRPPPALIGRQVTYTRLLAARAGHGHRHRHDLRQPEPDAHRRRAPRWRWTPSPPSAPSRPRRGPTTLSVAPTSTHRTTRTGTTPAGPRHGCRPPLASQEDRVLRSLFSGITGLRQHQTLMDVVGNNIANVNTVGYKSSSVVFEDTLSQMMRAAAAPNGRRRRRRQPRPGRPRRPARRHQHELRPGLGAEHRPRHRPHDPGRRLLRAHRTATPSSTPGPGRSRSTPTARLVNPEGFRVQGWTANARRRQHERRPSATSRAVGHADPAQGVRERRRSAGTSSPTPTPTTDILTLGQTVYDAARAPRTRSRSR